MQFRAVTGLRLVAVPGGYWTEVDSGSRRLLD